MHMADILVIVFRSFLTSLAGTDVPVLLSPVPFQNAALSSPQVRGVNLGFCFITFVSVR